MLRQLLHDEAGFIVSAELVLVATLLVLGLIVGMSQVQFAVNEELNDVAHAIGALNQSYHFHGFRSTGSSAHTPKATFHGSLFKDEEDECDQSCDIVCTAPAPTGECQTLF